MPEKAIAILRAVLGVAVLLSICWACSHNRRRINWRLVASGIGLQLLLAFLMLKVPVVEAGVKLVATLFVKIIDFSMEGTRFLFGELVTDEVINATLGFKVMPAIIFFSAITSILYYLGILQKIVGVFAWMM